MKNRIFTFIFLLTCAVVSGQAPAKRGGLQGTLGLAGSLYEKNLKLEAMYGAHGYAKYNLNNNYTDFSPSAGTGVNLFYHPESGSDSTSFFSIDVPLILELNYGHLATKDFYNPIGVFAGGGYDFNYFNEELYSFITATAGLRWYMLGGRSFTLRYFRFFNENKQQGLQHSVNLGLNVGNYLKSVKANNDLMKFNRPLRKKF